MFAAGARLPLDGIVAERASDRVPPRLLADDLRKAADGVDLEGDAPELEAWIAGRRALLTLADPPVLAARVPYLADIPRWVDEPIVADEPTPVSGVSGVSEAGAEAEVEPETP